MTRGVKPGKRRIDAGRRRPPRPAFTYPPPSDSPLLRAFRGAVDPAEWEALRIPTWRAWLELVRGGSPAGEEPRDRDRDWPPAAAIHDGIEGRVLKSRWDRPEGYRGGWDAPPRIVELAEEGLEELARFRRRSPAAARSISGPLREYARRLREVRDRCELRLFQSP
jgi:hypothetical protein